MVIPPNNRAAYLRRSSTMDGKTVQKSKNNVSSLSRTFSNDTRRQSCVLYRTITAEHNENAEEKLMVTRTPSNRWRLAQDKLNQRNEDSRKRCLSRDNSQ